MLPLKGEYRLSTVAVYIVSA